MKIKNKVIAFILFAILFIFCSYRVYHVFGYQDNVHSKAVFQQFYELPEDIVDAVWIGPSSVQEYVIPAVMYEETGIALYPLALGSMPFDATEYVIKECEKTQNPQVYLVDIRNLAYNNTLSDAAIRRVTDNMKFSKNRFDAVNGMLSDWKKFFPDQQVNLLGYYFPFFEYHTRWKEIKKTDFAEDENSFLGYWIDRKVTAFDKNEVMGRYGAGERAIPEENDEFLREFLDFCDAFDKTVIFTCMPNCLDEEKFGQYNYIKRVIAERGYQVWDLNYDVDAIGLDYAVDFKDNMHTNVQGAHKVSAYAAQYLTETYSLEDHRNDSRYDIYVKSSKQLQARLRETSLKSTTNFDEYLDRLADFAAGYTVYIGVKDIQGYCLTAGQASKLNALGLKSAYQLLEHSYHSYLAIISDGFNIFETIGQGDDPSSFSGTIGNTSVSMSSMTLQGGNLCSIKLGVIERAKNSRGLNFVVVDNETGEIVDSVAFDTHEETFKCIR